MLPVLCGLGRHYPGGWEEQQRLRSDPFPWLFSPGPAAPLTCSEGQPYSGWGLRPCRLTSEATLSQCLAVIQKLVILRGEAGRVLGEAPGGLSPRHFPGQQLP